MTTGFSGVGVSVGSGVGDGRTVFTGVADTSICTITGDSEREQAASKNRMNNKKQRDRMNCFRMMEYVSRFELG
ncbi:MAG: hypothetical protein HC804_05295 [Anaerolineae bacterium]|nr:hypothetical protein [Anaerolineae bacterium]